MRKTVIVVKRQDAQQIAKGDEMRDIAKAAHEGVETGRTGFMRPDDRDGGLEQFQAVYVVALAMQQDGLILIQKVHRESSSGRQLIDSIQFMRVK